jgi:hypothetical protein
MDKSNLIDLLSLDLEGARPDLPPQNVLSPSIGHPPSVSQRRSGTLNTPEVIPSTNIWDPRLILDLAIGVDGLEEILPRYDLTEEEFTILSDIPAFRRELAMAMRDAREYGLPFTKKAKVQAESYLEVLDHLVYSDLTPANVRLEAIRSTVRWAGLEPKETAGTGDGEKNVINVQINF